MDTPVVYAVQNQHRMDESGNLVPKFNLTPANEYGKLQFLLRPGASPFRPEEFIAELRKGLKNYTSRDYILLIGSPVLIGATVALAAQRTGGTVNLLQWSGSRSKYIAVKVKI